MNFSKEYGEIGITKGYMLASTLLAQMKSLLRNELFKASGILLPKGRIITFVIIESGRKYLVLLN